MPRRVPFALLLSVAALAILAPNASAITLTSHVVKPHGITAKADRHLVLVRTVAPPDRDDDGCPDSRDDYNGPGCEEPAPVAQPVTEPLAPTPTATSVAPTTAGTPPAYIAACESGDSYTAVNPSSGAYGRWQILPSTSASYGCDMSTPAGQDACAAEIYADVGSSAWVCG